MIYSIRGQRPLLPFFKTFLVVPPFVAIATLVILVFSCFLSYGAPYASGPYWVWKLFTFMAFLTYYMEHCRAEFFRRWTDDVRTQLEECNAVIARQNDSLRAQNEILEKALKAYEDQQ